MPNMLMPSHRFIHHKLEPGNADALPCWYSAVVSLFFHLSKPNVRSMLNLGRHIRLYSRLMMGLFAVQFIVAGFCLVPASLHAAGMVMTAPLAAELDRHCDSHMIMAAGHMEQQAACTHCDLPEGWISKVASSESQDDLSFAAYVAAHWQATVRPLSVDLSLRPATGPPPSSPLFYHTNQRILI